jgi:hypothetical protein
MYKVGNVREVRPLRRAMTSAAIRAMGSGAMLTRQRVAAECRGTVLPDKRRLTSVATTHGLCQR